MPTIQFQLEDLSRMVGRNISPEDLEQLSHYAKGELDGYDKKTDEAAVSLDDTNLPYLWSVEGLARLFRGVYDKINKKAPIKKSDYTIHVNPKVKDVRPYIAAFVFKGAPLSDYLLKQMVQLQEKFCEGYGRKREKVSIGLYSYKRITWPVHYTTTKPQENGFIPLGFTDKLTPAQILKQHPKGHDYGWILKNKPLFPLLIDDKKQVLSLPPIINSDFTGKIEVGDTDILFEVTGLDEDAINLATNIFAQALSERGYTIYDVRIKYGKKTVVTPTMKEDSITISREQVRKLLGLDLTWKKIKDLLERAGFHYSAGKVTIPPYRGDIMHPFDVIEDIAIMYGFHNIEPLPMQSYTVGESLPMVKLVDKVREVMVGLGFQEIMSPILTNKEALYDKMNIKDTGTVEIEQFMSETYSVVRSWLFPILMEVLSKNKHVEYPQKIFEQGIISVRDKNKINDYECIAGASAHTNADFTEIKQVLEALMRSLGLEFEVKEKEHGSFIEGRCGTINVKGKVVAYLGEIHPKVLTNWGIDVPVVAYGMNLNVISKVVE